jgi:hypothetical protein
VVCNRSRVSREDGPNTPMAGDGPAGMVEDRRGDRGDAGDVLLLRDGVAARPGQREVGGERLLLGNGGLGEALELQPIDERALLMRLDEGEQGFAAGGAMQRGASADLDAEAIGAAATALVDIKHLAIVDGAERGSLARLLGQPVERRRAGAAQVERFPDAMGELEQAVAEPIGIVAFLMADQAEGQQGVEHAR